MNFAQPVPANSESAELLQPTDGPLDRPTNGSQMIQFGFPTTGNSRFDPRRGQQGSSGLAVVTLVSRHGPRRLSRAAWHALNPGEFQEHQRQQLPQVRQFGGDQRSGQRNTGGGRQQMVKIFCQTPAAIHSRSQRPQALYQQPSSKGRSSQAMPVFSTNRIAVNTVRLPAGERPPSGERGRMGKKRSISVHNSSVSNQLDMATPP